MHWAVVFAGLAGIAAACSSVSYGMYLHHKSLDQQLADADRLFHDAASMRNKLEELRSRHAVVMKDVETRLGRIPSVASDSDVLRPVSSECELNGLTITNFRPQTLNEHAGFSEQVVAVQASGSYAAICKTLYSLRRLPWCTRVAQLTLTGQNGEDQTMLVDLHLAIATKLKAQL